MWRNGRRGHEMSSPYFLEKMIRAKQMIEQSVIQEIIEEYIEEQDKSLFLVEAKVHPNNKIVVEIDSLEGVDLDTCVALNKYMESKLDRDEEDFELEVGSPILTAPLRHPMQYQKFIEQPVEVLSKKGIKEKGVLKSFDGESLSLDVIRKLRKEGDKRKKEYHETETFALDDLKWTKYLLSV